jgi:hypothetical protein
MRPFEGGHRRIMPLRTAGLPSRVNRIARLEDSVLDLRPHWAPRMRVHMTVARFDLGKAPGNIATQQPTPSRVLGRAVSESLSRVLHRVYLTVILAQLRSL